MKIKSMKQRILMLLLGCLSTGGLLSQNSNITKQINDIKRDGRYFYAESTLETEEEAREAATLMLANYINDYINDLNLPLENKVTEQSLTMVQYIKGKRGMNMRVFAYVNKADYVPVEPGVGTDSTNESDEDTSLESKVEPIEAPTVEPQSQPLAELETSVVVNTPNEGFTSSDASMPLLVEWQQEALNEMLKKPNLQGVIDILNRMKVDYKVKRFGTYNECRNVAGSFWIIIENNADKNLVTILGPGADNRINFRTRQYDLLNNYFGKDRGAVWFEFAK